MKVHSIFTSVAGECNRHGIGAMTTFLRLAGCTTGNCPYCDSLTAKDPNSGKEMSIDEIVIALELLKCKRVTITGGEPLEQKFELVELLTCIANDYSVSIETNGFCSFDANVYPYNSVNWVVDIKNHGMVILSRFVEMNLRSSDFIKQVVGSIEEFEAAVTRKLTLQHRGCLAAFVFSPEYEKITPNELVKLMKNFGQWDASLSVQMHKICEIEEQR